MSLGWASCSWCGAQYLKDNRHINENKKLGNKFYCSPQCQYSARRKQQVLICSNEKCGKEFSRQISDIIENNYCSRSCAAIINSKKFPKRISRIINCYSCGSKRVFRRKYCSHLCKLNALNLSKDSVLERIKKFYYQHSRIPFKKDLWGIYKPARKHFGTWNKAIELAGFKPNPVLFANRQVAKDGHICDSIAERIIDDYLYRHGIVHERNAIYPEGKYTADFKVQDYIIEYFGLSGEYKKYDDIKMKKQAIVKQYRLKLIEIYPEDFYTQGGFGRVLDKFGIGRKSTFIFGTKMED